MEDKQDDPPPRDDEGLIVLCKAETNEHKGDMFTKYMDRHKFESCMQRIGMMPIAQANQRVAILVADHGPKEAKALLTTDKTEA